MVQERKSPQRQKRLVQNKSGRQENVIKTKSQVMFRKIAQVIVSNRINLFTTLAITWSALSMLWFIALLKEDSTGRMLRSVPATSGVSSDDQRFVVLDSKESLPFRSTTGQPLPGLFAGDRLYLLGARLTTHVSRNTVSITVFGMSGDLWDRLKSRKIRCPSNTTTSDYSQWNGPDGSLMGYPKAEQTQLYAQWSYDSSRGSSNLQRMEFIRSRSADFNQNNVTLIWNLDLEENGDMGITKRDLKERLTEDDKLGQESAIRVEFWIQLRYALQSTETAHYSFCQSS